MAREKKTGLERSITIDNTIKRLAAADIAAARERVDALFGAGAEPESADVAPSSVVTEQRRREVEARALIEKAERMLENDGADDREDLVDRIEALKDGLVASDEQAIQTAMDELADLLYSLEG